MVLFGKRKKKVLNGLTINSCCHLSAAKDNSTGDQVAIKKASSLFFINSLLIVS